MSNIIVMYSNEPPGRGHVQRLEELCSGSQVVVADDEHTAISAANEAEIILGHRYLRQVLPQAWKLRWIQSTAAGCHHLISDELLQLNPLLTRCPIFSNSVAQHAFILAMSIVRRIPDAVQAQMRGEWARPFDLLASPRTAMVFGMGYIGQTLGKLLRQNGIYVLGVGRRAAAEQLAACNEWIDAANWRAHLGGLDLCFICAPLTRSTVGIFNESVLRKLPAHAVLVNVARGELIDTPALRRVLESGHLGGAALDVVSPLPGNPDDPIWRTPRLLITPKVAVFHRGRQAELEAFVERQVALYRDGQSPLYAVDLKLAMQELR